MRRYRDAVLLAAAGATALTPTTAVGPLLSNIIASFFASVHGTTFVIQPFNTINNTYWCSIVWRILESTIIS